MSIGPFIPPNARSSGEAALGVSGSTSVVVKTTSRQYGRNSFGCQPKDRFHNFYIPNGSSYIRGSTWVCLKELYDLNGPCRKLGEGQKPRLPTPVKTRSAAPARRPSPTSADSAVPIAQKGTVSSGRVRPRNLLILNRPEPRKRVRQNSRHEDWLCETLYQFTKVKIFHSG